MPHLTRLEHRIMDVIWDLSGPVSIREIQEVLPEKTRPAYSTVQTIVYRLEAKKAVRRVRKIGNAHVFEATISLHVDGPAPACGLRLPGAPAGQAPRPSDPLTVRPTLRPSDPPTSKVNR